MIAAFGILVGYQYFAAFYRESAREIKRLGKHFLGHHQSWSYIHPHQDAILRSLLYAHFAESLSGLPTIRSYGEVERFLSDNEYYTDLEDRANFLVATNQRWLAIRLDFLGGLMTFVVRRIHSSDAVTLRYTSVDCYAGCERRVRHQSSPNRSRSDIHQYVIGRSAIGCNTDKCASFVNTAVRHAHTAICRSRGECKVASSLFDSSNGSVELHAIC